MRLYGVVVLVGAVLSSGVEAVTSGAYTLCVHSDLSFPVGCGPGPGVWLHPRGRFLYDSFILPPYIDYVYINW